MHFYSSIFGQGKGFGGFHFGGADQEENIFGGRGRARRSREGEDVLAKVDVTFEEAALGADNRIGSILTQNVDGLHTQAGSRDVLELHGNIHHVACLGCGATFTRAALQMQLEADNPGLRQVLAQPLPDGDAEIDPDAVTEFTAPACVHCGGTLMPDVVFFGDNVPAARTALM